MLINKIRKLGIEKKYLDVNTKMFNKENINLAQELQIKTGCKVTINDIFVGNPKLLLDKLSNKTYCGDKLKKFLIKRYSSYRSTVSKGKSILGVVSELNIKSCLYCDINSIALYKKNQKVFLELDHFYPKSKYPILTANLYNLIPSCRSCNQVKTNKEIDFVYNPFFTNKPLYEYKLINESDKSDVIGYIGDFNDVKINIELIPTTGNLKPNFYIEERYEIYRDFACELHNISYASKLKEEVNKRSNIFLKEELNVLENGIVNNGLPLTNLIKNIINNT